MMSMLKKISHPFAALCSLLLLISLFASSPTRAQTQNAPDNKQAAAPTGSDGIALAPARFELEMTPGSETTVVINLDYHTSKANAQPSRLVASLNDWDINRKGELEFYKAGMQPNSATPWMIYSPGEVTVQPGQTHSIRVTVSVPRNATPGDHLAALVVEQRPDTIKLNRNARQMLMRFRMAAMFYITIPQATRRGTLADLQAAVDANGITITPTLKNEGNSAIRPTSSVKIENSNGLTVAELAESEALPLLGGSSLSQPLIIEKNLAPGTYTVRYRVDFQDGGKTTEGITELIILPAQL